MSVASRFIKQDSEKLGIGPFVDSLCAMAVNIHRSVERETVRFYNELGRHNYTTPTSYLELIKLYIELMSKQRDVIFGNQQRYTGGLQKLGETEVMVGELQPNKVCPRVLGLDRCSNFATSLEINGVILFRMESVRRCVPGQL